MKERKAQHRIFKADPAKVEAYLLLGDEYDFNEGTEYVEELVNKLREVMKLKDEKDNEEKGSSSPKGK